MKISMKKKIAAAAAAATIVGGAGAALAFWTTTGTGTGSAATTAGVDGTLGITSAELDEMYPGDSPQPVTVTVVNNDLNEAVQVTTVKAYLTVVGSGVCDASDFKLTGVSTAADAASAVTLDWTAQELAANGGTADTGGLDTIQFNNKASNQDGCKSATVTLNYLAS